MTLAFCWAHLAPAVVRHRQIAAGADRDRGAEADCRTLPIEAEIRGKSADERRAVRQKKSRPLVAALKAWLESTLPKVAGGSSIAQTVRYGLNHWDGLVRFLNDGRIEIDSNTVERSMRPVVEQRLPKRLPRSGRPA